MNSSTFTPIRGFISMKSIASVLVLSAIISAILFTRLGRSKGAVVESASVAVDSSVPASAVTLERPTPCDQCLVKYNGRLTWNDNVTTRLFSPFAGRVAKILVESGQRVSKGDPLAQIESADYGQAQADAAKASSDFTLAERNLLRVQQLFEHGAAPAKDLASAEADVARWRSDRDRTSARLALYGDTNNVIDQHYTLRSPIDGFVVEKSVNPGQEVRPDQMLAGTPQLAAPLFVITDPTQLWVWMDASEMDLGQIKSGTKCSLHAAPYPDQTFTGMIDFIADSLDPSSRTVKVRGIVGNGDRHLKSEMLVTIEVPTLQKGALEISSQAVFLQGDGNFVVVQESNGKFARRPVKIGRRLLGRVLVMTGLKSSDQVVSEGAMLIAQTLNDDAQL